MRIELITMWYNEEFFAPYFLKHYSWVDKIHVILDKDTNDNTETIIKCYSNVEVSNIKFPDMMDDELKVQTFNEKYKTLTEADYVILVDSDEFIFCNNLCTAVRSHIEKTQKDIYFVNLWQIYENEHDLPMNIDVPVPYLRRHGDPDMEEFINSLYIKPSIVKGSRNLYWTPGNHEVFYNGNRLKWQQLNYEAKKAQNISDGENEMLQGAHWRLINLQETIKRRIHNRKDRQSKANIINNRCLQYHHTTEEEIIAEYEKNKNRPVVIFSRGHGNSDSSQISLSESHDQNRFQEKKVQQSKKDAYFEVLAKGITRSLDLGCGLNPINPFKADEAFGIDVRENLSRNIKKADLCIEPIPYADESFEYVTAFDFIEHIPRVIYTPERRTPFIDLMNEIYRVLKVDGIFISLTPAYPHPEAFQDPTHVNIITENTFNCYFDDKKRWASMYGFNGAFSLIKQEWFGENKEKLFIQLRKVPVK